MQPRPRMPKTFRFPFGFAIKIRYCTRRQLKAAGLANCYGAWVVSERTIYLDKQEHLARQALTLAHELQHASVDFLHWVDEWIAQPLVSESIETMRDLEGEE